MLVKKYIELRKVKGNWYNKQKYQDKHGKVKLKTMFLKSKENSKRW